MPIQQYEPESTAQSFVPAPAFIATDPTGNVISTAGRLVEDAQTGQRWGEYEDMPPTQGQAGQSNMPVNPLEELQKRTQMRTQYIEQEIGAQESALQQGFDKQYGDLEGQYNIERHYIQNSPSIEPQQKARQIEQLNKRYELKVNDLRSQVQPGMQQLDAQRRQAMMQIEEDRQRREHEISIIDRLAQQGVIEDPAAVLQQKLQAAGVNVPIGALRVETPEQKVQQSQAELRYIDQLLRGYAPPKTRRLRSDLPGTYTTRTLDGDETYELSAEESAEFEALADRAIILRQKLARDMEGLYQMRNAMDRAEDLKRAGKPMADQAHKITHPGGKSGASQTQEVTVRSPGGKIGTVPVSELAQAITEGYTIVTGR